MRRGRPPRNRIRTTSSGAAGQFDGAGKANIPTDLLRTFVAICELRSFTKAAHLFGLTQPAVSAHMRRLEMIIGADLIDKGLSGVALTECGQDVLRHARRMLAINDQIVGGGGLLPQPDVIRLGIPNLYAPNKLARILSECSAHVGGARLQIRCDQSPGLLDSVRAGYLELAAVLSGGEEFGDALVTWADDMVWVRAPDFVPARDRPVPLIGSPNLLRPDRAAMETLEQAGRQYEIVFTAFDVQARRAAAAAGLGYLVLPRAVVMETLVIEEPGILPDLPRIILGIVAREDFDVMPFRPLISAIQNVLTS